MALGLHVCLIWRLSSFLFLFLFFLFFFFLFFLPQIPVILNQMDIDGDGKISFEEFVQVAEQMGLDFASALDAAESETTSSSSSRSGSAARLLGGPSSYAPMTAFEAMRVFEEVRVCVFVCLHVHARTHACTCRSCIHAWVGLHMHMVLIVVVPMLALQLDHDGDGLVEGDDICRLMSQRCDIKGTKEQDEVCSPTSSSTPLGWCGVVVFQPFFPPLSALSFVPLPQTPPINFSSHPLFLPWVSVAFLQLWHRSKRQAQARGLCHARV